MLLQLQLLFLLPSSSSVSLSDKWHACTPVCCCCWCWCWCLLSNDESNRPVSLRVEVHCLPACVCGCWRVRQSGQLDVVPIQLSGGNWLVTAAAEHWRLVKQKCRWENGDEHWSTKVVGEAAHWKMLIVALERANEIVMSTAWLVSAFSVTREQKCKKEGS